MHLTPFSTIKGCKGCKRGKESCLQSLYSNSSTRCYNSRRSKDVYLRSSSINNRYWQPNSNSYTSNSNSNFFRISNNSNIFSKISNSSFWAMLNSSNSCFRLSSNSWYIFRRFRRNSSKTLRSSFRSKLLEHLVQLSHKRIKPKCNSNNKIWISFICNTCSSCRTKATISKDPSEWKFPPFCGDTARW